MSLTSRGTRNGAVIHEGRFGTASTYARHFWLIESRDGVKNIVAEEEWAVQWIAQGFFTVLPPEGPQQAP